MMPWSCHVRFDSDGSSVDGVTKAAMTRPAFCPVCTKSDRSISLSPLSAQGTAGRAHPTALVLLARAWPRRRPSLSPAGDELGPRSAEALPKDVRDGQRVVI